MGIVREGWASRRCVSIGGRWSWELDTSVTADSKPVGAFVVTTVNFLLAYIHLVYFFDCA